MPKETRGPILATLTITLAVFALAGCVDPGANLNGAGTHPPLLFAANNQTHTLLVIGGESGLPWANLTITQTGPCTVNAPTQGSITPGQAIHILGQVDKDCSFSVTYSGVLVGTYSFGPSVPHDLGTITQTQTVPPTQTKTTSSQPPQHNQTVPP